jgi:hypothetical protein
MVVNPASAFYLLGYQKEVPLDGKFHEIKVRVKQQGLEVRARSGYWAPRLAEVTRAKEIAAEAVLPQPIDTAFASLRSVRSRAAAEVWTGVSATAQRRPQVTVAWTAYPREDVPAGAASVYVSALAGGKPIFTGDVEATGTSFPATPGEIDLAITVRDSAGEVLDRIPRKLTVGDPASPALALGTPVVVRMRSPREVREIAAADRLPLHAGREFERTDRVLVCVGTYGPEGGVTVTASLLDRRGAKLVALPVHRDAARGGYEIDLPMANIARGEYVIAIEARRGEDRAEAHVAFRIVR